MFWQNLKIAFRNILKDKGYSIINILGLSVALTCCFLLIFWIKFELSYENGFPLADRTYQVLQVEKRTDGLHKDSWIRPGIANQLKEAFPEIEAVTVMRHADLPMSYEDSEGIMVDYVSATPGFLDIFSYEYTEPPQPLFQEKPDAVLLEESIAKKFFGNEPATGKVIHILGMKRTVAGVAKVPKNTHICFDVLTLSDRTDYGIHYVLFKENVVFTSEVKRKLANFLASISDSDNKLSFMPIKEIHLHSPKELAVNSFWQTFGDPKQLYLFSIAALLILFIAVINYINTSTARAMTRVKEVGVRKMAGSTQSQLIFRFLLEAFLISFVAVIIAYDLSKLLFAEFSMLMGNKISLQFDWGTIIISIIVCLFITVLSGGYAAFYLSSFNPIAAFKGGNKTGSREGFRKVLIGIQFFLAIGILTCTALIYKQINYMFNTSGGVDKDNILVIHSSLWYDAESFFQIIKNENPNVVDATIASAPPYNAQYGYSGVYWEGAPDGVKETEFAQIFCDHNYAHTFGLQVVQGNFIPPNLSWWQYSDEDSYGLVINESFKTLMGMDNPIGVSVDYAFGMTGKIIGVVKDFNFKPLKEPITPLIMSFNPETSGYIYVKTTGKDKQATEKYVLDKFKEMYGQDRSDTKRPLIYYTVEDDYRKMYHSELRTSKILFIFSVISLALSLMGIFGMVLFVLEKRVKEIAVRKINGAETKDIILLFVKEFSVIIAVAAVLVIPIAYIIINRWIQGYAYRTPLSWWVFAGVCLLIFIATIVLIALQVYHTARKNPVDSLRSE